MDTIEAINIEETDSTYGGWLRFFRIINSLYWIIGALCILAFPPLIYFTWGDSQSEAIDMLAMFIEVIPGTIMSYLIWKTVLVKSESSPNKIKWLMQLELSLHIIITAGMLYAYKQGYISEGPTPILLSIFYFLIWASYFKRSKRTLAYYGSNTSKPS